MKKAFNTKWVILLAAILTTTIVFVGCQPMDDARHNDEEGRDGVSGYALTMQVNPSRVPANENATMEARVRFIKLKDMSPVPNTRIRLMIGAANYEYLDPYIVHFGDHTLLTDVVTNGAGEASVTMYVGGLGQAIPELMYSLDAQATVEYEKWNTLNYFAQETFYIYNPHWDGRLPPDKIPPTAIIYYYPMSGIKLGDPVTFLGGNSYDRGQSGSSETWNRDKAYDEIIRYNWFFGDGDSTSGAAKQVTHSYKNYGVYTVQLIVTDDEGMSGSTTASVNVPLPTPVPTAVP